MRTSTLLSALPLVVPLLGQPTPSYYWRLDELGGTVAHAAAGGSDGLLQGACTWQPTSGHHAGALRTYGNDARVDLGPCDITTGAGDAISIACWFHPQIVSGDERVLVSKTIGPGPDDFIWSLSLVNSTGARFRLRAGGTVHTVEIPPASIFSNTWYHLAATYNGSTIRLFLNGSPTASGTASGAIGFHPQAPATLGNLIDNSAPFFGMLDDVRIYDHALTGLDVVDLVIGDINTGIAEPPMLITQDGQVLLTSGSGGMLSVHDPLGRILLERNLPPGGMATLPVASAGPFLVCLQEGHTRHVQRVVMP